MTSRALFEELADFLKREELKISGKINKIQVDQDLWKKKMDFVAAVANEFMEYSNAYLNLLRNKDVRFSEYLKRQTEDINIMSPDEMMGADEFLNGFIHLVKSHKKNLELMLSPGYSAPHHRPVAIRDQLSAFMFYLFYSRDVFKFYLPGVNERINYVGMNLIRESTITTSDISRKGTHQDQIKSGTDTKRILVKTRRGLVKQEYNKLVKNNDQELIKGLSLTAVSRKIFNNLNAYLKQKRIKGDIETIKQDLKALDLHIKKT